MNTKIMPGAGLKTSTVTKFNVVQMDPMVTLTPSSFKLTSLCQWMKRMITRTVWHKLQQPTTPLARTRSPASCTTKSLFRFIPDYWWLAALACVVCPPLGVAVCFLNKRAKTRLKEGHLHQANRLYFLTIVLGVSSVVLTLCVCAEIGVNMYFSPRNHTTVASRNCLKSSNICHYLPRRYKSRTHEYKQEMFQRYGEALTKVTTPPKPGRNTSQQDKSWFPF